MRSLLLLKPLLSLPTPKIFTENLQRKSTVPKPFRSLFLFLWLCISMASRGTQSGMNDEAVELGTAKEGRVDA